MTSLIEWFSRVFGLFRRRQLDRQTEAEMKFHVELEIEKGLCHGLTRSEAEREARLKVGSINAAMEPVYDQRGLNFLDGTSLDIRHSCSSFVRRPGFLFIAGGALAAAVAINTLIFAIVDGVILRPLPYPHPERLVRVFEATQRNPKFQISIYNYLEDKRANRTLDGIALYTRDDHQLMHDDRPERLSTVAITDDFLPVLGVSPMLGRNFLPSELNGNARVVILSYSLWTSRFRADPEIVGKTIRLDRQNWTVVGVLPAGFQHVGGSYRSPLQGDTVALWSPLNLAQPGNGVRAWHFTNAIARLKPGVPKKAAEEDLNRIMDDLAHRFPDNYAQARARIEPLSNEVVGKSNVTVGIIVAAGALVLLVACVNIAGLCVARVLSRKREIAIRQALGGTAWRVIRAVLSESLIVGCAGGLAGLALAGVLFPVLSLVLPADFPRLQEIHFSAAAAVFAVSSALLTSTLAGLVPAFRQIGVDPRHGLSEDSRTGSGSRNATRLRAALVAAEVALSCILCFGAVLLVRSSHLLSARDHGFNPHGVLTFQIGLARSAYPNDDRVTALYGDLARHLRSIPGVRAVGLATNLPWTGYDEDMLFDIVGRPRRAGESIQARYQAADPGFLAALHLRMVRGRWIEAGDLASSAPVLVINEALASRYFDTADPVGHYLDFGDRRYRIVGVVADVRDRPADPAAEPGFWWPLAQAPYAAFSIAVRTDLDPAGLVPAVRSAVASVDRELPLADVRSMDEIAATALAERTFARWLCAAFAALAMLLAAIGTYGMLSYMVEQRRREIGIRLALGASRPAVLWMVLSNGLTLAVFGIAVGILIAPLAGRGLSSLLYGVTASDAVTFIAAPLLILLITCLGCLAPGWTAAHTEPMSALRDQ
jgi:macrolide transport system ATP-binding/permease protein